MHVGGLPGNVPQNEKKGNQNLIYFVQLVYSQEYSLRRVIISIRV